MAWLADVTNGFVEWYRERSKMSKGLLVILTTYFFLAVCFLTVRGLISSKAGDMMKPYLMSNRLIEMHITENSIPVLGDTTYARIFQLQNTVIDLRRAHHYEVAMMFLKNYYGVIVCMIVVTCIGGLLLFILVNQGWAGSSHSVKLLFISFATAALFFSIFSSVFSQQANFEENMHRFMNYSRAQMVMAEQASILSKRVYPTVKRPRLDFPLSSKRKNANTIDVIDTNEYYRLLDTLIAGNNKIINDYTDYILTIDESQIGDISEVYESLLKFKSASSKVDTTGKANLPPKI